MRIHQETKEVVSHYELQQRNPNISLPREPMDLEEMGYYFIHDNYFPEPEWGETIVTGEPEFVDGKWRYSKNVVQTDLEVLRKEVLDAATEKRKKVMAGGVDLGDGSIIGTDDTDQARVTSVVANAQFVGLTDTDTVDFKAESGWKTITVGEVKTIAGIIGRFVQACFTAERAHHNAILDLTTREELAIYKDSYLLNGWPQSSAVA